MSTTLTAIWPAQLIAGANQSVTIGYAGSTPAPTNPITASAGTIGNSPQAVSGQLVSVSYLVPTTGTSVTFTDAASGATVAIPISGTPGTTRCLAFITYASDTPNDVRIPLDPDNFITVFAASGPNGATVDRIDTHANVGPPLGTPMIRNAPGSFFYWIADVAPAVTYNFFYGQTINGQPTPGSYWALPPAATPTPGTPSATTIAVDDVQTGQPIAGMVVWATSDPQGQTLAAGPAFTNSDGAAVLQLVAGTTYYLTGLKLGRPAIVAQPFVAATTVGVTNGQ